MAEFSVNLWEKRKGLAEQANNNWRSGFIVQVQDDGLPWGFDQDPRVWIGMGNTIETWSGLGKRAIIIAPGVVADYPQSMEREFRPSFMSEPEFIKEDEADKLIKWTRRKRWKVGALPSDLYTLGIATPWSI